MNYLEDIKRLNARGKLAGVHTLSIAHDSWCGFFRDKGCNCKPDIYLGHLPIDGQPFRIEEFAGWPETSSEKFLGARQKIS